MHLYNIRDDPLEMTPKEPTFSASSSRPTEEMDRKRHGLGHSPPKSGNHSDCESEDLPPPLASATPTEDSDSGGPTGLTGSDVWEGLLRDGNEMEEDEEEDDDEDEEDTESSDNGYVREVWEAAGSSGWDQLITPIVLPRRRFAGACNVETVKDGACAGKCSGKVQADIHLKSISWEQVMSTFHRVAMTGTSLSGASRTGTSLAYGKAMEVSSTLSRTDQPDIHIRCWQLVGLTVQSK